MNRLVCGGCLDLEKRLDALIVELQTFLDRLGAENTELREVIAIIAGALQGPLLEHAK